jgi:hypothetical protein
VDHERGDTAGGGDARDRDTVAMFAIPAGASFECHRNAIADRTHHRVEDARDQRFVLQQRRPAQSIADFFRRAAHVDVDDLRAEIDVATRRFGERLGFCTRQLHHAWLGLALVIHALS